MEFNEDNPNNPTLKEAPKVKLTHHFLIKYKTESQRKKISNLVISFIKKHELTDFHVEEKKAFVQERILYNMHTLKLDSNFSYEDLEEELLKYFD